MKMTNADDRLMRRQRDGLLCRRRLPDHRRLVLRRVVGNVKVVRLVPSVVLLDVGKVDHGTPLLQTRLLVDVDAHMATGGTGRDRRNGPVRRRCRPAGDAGGDAPALNRAREETVRRSIVAERVGAA